MAYTPSKVPEYQDRVKNIKNDSTGTVIAKYPFPTGQLNNIYLDIRLDSGHIWYLSPIENWEVVETEEEILSSE